MGGAGSNGVPPWARSVPGRPRLLVSVRDVREALDAARAGVDLIDLKEPRDGALGGLPPATIATVVRALRAAGHAQPVSATIGDWPAQARAAILERVAAVAAAGVDIVKVGIEPGPQAPALLDALAGVPATLVPVFLADAGLDAALVAQACHGPFPALMLDTAAKRGGTLLDLLDASALRGFTAQVQRAGRGAGLAGALRREQLGTLRALGADFVGFRSAVCEGDRGGALVPARVQALVAALRGQAAAQSLP